MSYGLESLETRQLEGIVNILNHCTDSFLYVFDFSKDTYFISPFARNLFNFPEEKLENATHELMKIVYPDDQASLRAEIDLLKSGKKTEHNLDYRWLNKNGKPVWIRCRGRKIDAPPATGHFPRVASVDERTDRMHIRRPVCWKSAELFRRGIADGAHRDQLPVFNRQGFRLAFRNRHGRCQPEIDQHRRTVVPREDVGRLDVAMNETMTMQFLRRRHDLPEELRDLAV